MGDFQILDRKLHINSLKLKVVILALHHWVTVLCGHQVMIATDNTTGRDPFLHPITSSSGSVSMATNSRHSHQGQTHSRLSECDSGTSIATKSANNNIVNKIFGSLESATVEMFVTVHNFHLPSLSLQFQSLEQWR